MITIPTPFDYDELLQIWETSVRSTHHFLTEENIQFYKPLVRDQYFPAVELFIIRNESGKIAAFMGLSDELIEMLFVHPNEQGKGYGKQFINYAEKEKRINKVDVNEQNEKALQFYLKRGFDVIGRDTKDSSGNPFPILHMAMIPSLATLLQGRIHMEDIESIHYILQFNEQRNEELYRLIFDKDLKLSYQALWACTHFSSSQRDWLQTKQEELIDEVLNCPHQGKRRILLQLLEKQTFDNDLRVDFLDFCLERMFDNQEPVGVQSLCIKIGYKLCQPIPELMQEYRAILEIQKAELLPPALRASRRNILKEMNKKK